MSSKELSTKRLNTNNKKNNNIHKERTKKKIVDQVQSDGRLKIYINRENELQAQWPERWGFYSKKNIEKMWSEESIKLGLPKDFIDYRREKQRKQNTIQPLISVVPSPITIPQTSSGFIGWRSSHYDCNLEIFGRMFTNSKPDPRMFIPDNEPDPRYYHFIILG
ncbi:uncharacterized protein C20orf85-like [Daktulosphaira vitifoliae]|uniref:uncharacterized protein C20orf85-like n=1 Tax=Daktulosphaira vitifoliae TaxID=58002 RepID=UPI0021AACA53|nr:uncharacterized protein C20orf85-like [Daktulosphaira vitifoliae]